MWHLVAEWSAEYLSPPSPLTSVYMNLCGLQTHKKHKSSSPESVFGLSILGYCSTWWFNMQVVTVGQLDAYTCDL